MVLTKQDPPNVIRDPCDGLVFDLKSRRNTASFFPFPFPVPEKEAVKDFDRKKTEL